MRVIHRVTLAAAASVGVSAIVAAGVAIVPAAQAQTRDSFVGGFSTHTVVASTVPGNGDLNPYGVAVVRHSLGKLHRDDVLVSNFNNSQNQQGTGTTIVEISPGGQQSLFAQINAADLPGQCPGGVGLTTALDILRNGWVVVGSLPTNAGSPTSSKAGCLLVLNSQGRVVEAFHGQGINGPWDMTAVDLGGVTELFVTNVLNGTVAANSKQLDTQVDGGTVLRLVVTTPRHGLPRLLNVTKIGSGFPEELDASALVIGPTGVGLGKDGTLYVADTLDNRIAAIPDAKFRFSDAATGKTLTSGGSLNGPLGLTIAPNGDVLTVNSGDGNLVETTPAGMQFAPVNLDSTGSPPPPGGAGALFGLAVAPHGKGVYYVDDNTNTLDLLH
jgi:sugar lactone lactonase YvrE